MAPKATVDAWSGRGESVLHAGTYVDGIVRIDGGDADFLQRQGMVSLHCSRRISRADAVHAEAVRSLRNRVRRATIRKNTSVGAACKEPWRVFAAAPAEEDGCGW